MSTYSTYSQDEKELYSEWCSKFGLARHRLLAIVKRIGIAIDKEISLNIYLKFCESVIVEYCLIDGKIEAYDMPDEPHAMDNTFALLALLYSRNNPNPTTPIIVKLFAIPTNPLFNGAHGDVPIGIPQNFYIDLFILQDVYQNALET
ncbi:5046_t:CDS:2 [Diversispora eburnea]|uniref:5046_t:CDS:1 n=1 Tax=Diversispora eburnea TaxID=1213867 RepID=A0A9N9FXN7_9GLOM|nr:5046_t:CDS:2 [Diversispora eburnea]